MAIIIDSYPISVDDICNVSPGQIVTFTITSGYTTDSYFQWYLNGVLVSIGSGYTLLPEQYDDVQVKKVECSIKCNTIKLVDYTDVASHLNVGTLRYRTTSNSSSVDMSMQIGTNIYEWVQIQLNTW